MFTRIKNLTNRVVLSLSRVHPLKYIFIYAALIPAYALAYWSTAPDGFYAPYVRYEPTWKQDGEQARNLLEKAIKRNVQERQHDRFTAFDAALNGAFSNNDELMNPHPHITDTFGDDILDTSGKPLSASFEDASFLWDLEDLRVDDVSTDGSSVSFVVHVQNRLAYKLFRQSFVLEKEELEYENTTNLSNKPNVPIYPLPNPPLEVVMRAKKQFEENERTSKVTALSRYDESVRDRLSAEAFRISADLSMPPLFPGRQLRIIVNGAQQPVIVAGGRPGEAVRGDTLIFSGVFERFSDLLFLKVTEDEYARLARFAREYNGISSAIGGNPWRMLYLSVVVITTLGLGDIVPLTGWARTLVGCEAVSGILFAGLFLNALAYRASHPPSNE
jgi:hypothetical protein